MIISLVHHHGGCVRVCTSTAAERQKLVQVNMEKALQGVAGLPDNGVCQSG